MLLEDFIISVYCLVDDELKNLIKERPLRARGFAPKLSDAEVITMDIVGEFMGKDTDKGIWQYFRTHWQLWFPELGSRSNYVKQSANLWQVHQQIQRVLANKLSAFADSIHLADGFPIAVCHFKRARSSKVFRGTATYGYCASKEQTYYGFKGNLCVSSEGIITGITVTPAHIDERESLYEVVSDIQGLLLADKGLIGQDYQQDFRLETGINLQTPRRGNMTDSRGKDANRWIISTRRLVETVIGQLTERFHIEKVRARDCWHLTKRIARKVLAHTVGAVICKSQGYSAIQFEKLGI